MTEIKKPSILNFGGEKEKMTKFKANMVSENIWEIPKTQKDGMQVPARIYASDKLFKEMDEGVFEQVTNMACMPGIQRHAMAMPDAHWGYGAPVGGVAAFDIDEGVISPGVIGFDINCIQGNTKIRTIDGEIPIKKFEKKNLPIANFNNREFLFTYPTAFMKLKKKIAFKLETELGNKITATADHPFLTQSGMMRLEKLRIGDKLALFENKLYFDKITKIKKINFDDFVYDFTIPKTHNFVANNFITHNCGMRLLKTNLTLKEVQPKIKQLVNSLFEKVPAGVGRRGFVKINEREFKEMVEVGVNWCVKKGFGWKKDLDAIEEHGCIKAADSSKISQKAIARGIDQIGTLGSGNHYLEIQVAEENAVHDKKVAKALGITQHQQVVIMVHCGSRGFGHQVATDYLDMFEAAMKKYKISVKDPQLACVPFNSKEGQDYYAAMVCAANNAFVNRQIIIHRVREVFSQVFGYSAEDLGMEIVYDVAHNIAKVEKHKVDGRTKEVVVHRKGATRSFPPGHPELKGVYGEVGQPVIVGGSMETGSFLCVGTDHAMEETFGSTMHGSGRTMSRAKAKNEFKTQELEKALERKGIFVKAASKAGLAEEAGGAYKNINEVVDTMHNLGISKKVVGLRPIGNIKG